MPPCLFVVFSVLMLIGGVSCLHADGETSDWFFRAWQTEDGLPDNSISGVAQSPDGYLWVGTNGGAMRFNGTDFHSLPLRDLSALPSRQVRAMFLDRLGRLWLGMERGPVIRVGEDSYRVFGDEDGISENRAMSMTDDPLGRVWVSFGRSVCIIDSDEVTRLDAEQGIPTGRFASLSCDASGQVWLANGGKLGCLTDQGFELVRDFADAEIRMTPARGSAIWLMVGAKLMLLDTESQFSQIASLPDGVEVNTIFEDRNGVVWIGTERAGLFRVEDRSWTRIATSHVSVECITEDREGNIWVGTSGGGLNLIRPRVVKFIDTENGLPFRSVRSTACDASGRIWAVSEDGRLGYQKNDEWHLYTKLGRAGAVNCVTADSLGRVWVGTRDQGLLRIEGEEVQRLGRNEGLAGLSVRSLLADRRDHVWIATDSPDELHRLSNGELTQINHTSSLHVIRALADDADGNLWIGTSDGRLLRVDGDQLIDESDIDGPALLSIRTLHATPDGSLWIGYAGDGLGHFKDGEYKRITTAVGLYDDYISQIQDDGAGSLWIAANRGLFQVSQEELLAISAEPNPSMSLRCRVFSRVDGVPSIQPSRDYAPAACQSPDGHLYFSTHSGILRLEPNKLRANALPPPVILEKASLDNEVLAFYQTRSMLNLSAKQVNLSLPTAQLDLPPDHERLAIDFAALSLASPENVGLRYRLQPMDTHWAEVENQRSVTFPRLPAGEYELQVIACNSVGVWNDEGATLSIIVRPFYWQTWWFRIGGGLLTALAAGGLVFMGLRRRHRHQLRSLAAKRAVEQERSRIARDIHDDLGASLTRITLLSQSSPPTENGSTNAVLDQIHSTSRELMRSMEEVVWAVNPEHDTFDALANYLSNYGQGFLGIAGVRCRLDMPMSLPERSLSAQIRHNLFLAFKEALNNAVKYAAATQVRISLKPGADTFNLRVEDNGEGIDPNASANPMRPTQGSGLANMKSRMDEIGGHCNVHSSLGQGTTVEFTVPFKINS